MNPLDLRVSMGSLQSQLTLTELLQTNEISQKHGLVLTAQQAQEILLARNRALSSHGRLELGNETVKKIITAFCTSAYIYQDEYAAIISELVEVFYYMKNETEDYISDDDLIEIMRDGFETVCQGSVELLRHREMDQLARQIREGAVQTRLPIDDDTI